MLVRPRADVGPAGEARRGRYPARLLLSRHEGGLRLSPPLAAAASDSLTARGQRDGRWASLRSRRGLSVSTPPSLCLHRCTSHTTPSHPPVGSSRLASALRPPCGRQHSINPHRGVPVRPGTASPLCQAPPFVFRPHPLSLTSIKHACFVFFSSSPSSFVEIRAAVFPASPSNISGYFSARVLFCPRSAARDPPLFNLLPLMTAKQAKVQVPTPRETRINLQ